MKILDSRRSRDVFVEDPRGRFMKRGKRGSAGDGMNAGDDAVAVVVAKAGVGVVADAVIVIARTFSR